MKKKCRHKILSSKYKIIATKKRNTKNISHPPKVLEAEAGREASEREHQKRATEYAKAQQKLAALGVQITKY